MKTERASAWSLTINNPTQTDRYNINTLPANWTIIGQEEVGKEGTPHLQLMLKTPQVRFSAVKKHFPRAHIEIARNVKALEEYVQKEDTRVSTLVQDKRFLTLPQLWDQFAEYIDNKRGAHNDWNEEEWLVQFDKFCNQAIEDGYHIELMAVNPQIRSCVKKFGISIYYRSLHTREIIKNGSIDRQTDRQTDENFILDIEQNGEETNEERQGQRQATEQIRQGRIRSGSGTEDSDSTR